MLYDEGTTDQLKGEHITKTIISETNEYTPANFYFKCFALTENQFRDGGFGTKKQRKMTLVIDVVLGGASWFL